jgi:L-threonylcarbamoyladenylate synthase
MNTIAISIESPFDVAEAIRRAVSAIRGGGVIIYPTDTIYGLGADATSVAGVERIRTIKGRADDKPILAMVTDLDMLEEYAVVTPLARRLAHRFLPGPLTLVLDTMSDTLAPIAAVDGSVGFRVPNDRLCLELVALHGAPITSTSVNRAGAEPATALDALCEVLGDGCNEIDLILNTGALPASAPSTIVDARGSCPIVLRHGTIDGNALRSVCE